MDYINFNNSTVDQIKKWAKTNDINIPSGLNKQKLIYYLNGILTERSNGIYKQKRKQKNIENLIPKWADNNINWLEHLHINGWAVVPLKNWDVNFTNDFFDWLESFNNKFKRNDFNTWIPDNMPLLQYGMLKHYIGHTEFIWKIRELCTDVFKEIWQCKKEELLSSFDGACFLTSNNSNKFPQWIHCDQPRCYPYFSSVQGIVNFLENGPEDGGLVLVEHSHKIFNDYMNKYTSEGIIFEKTNIDDPLLSSKNLIKICAPAGSIILFDSRTFHCNIHPNPSDSHPRLRLCTYVSMQPRCDAPPDILNKRIKLYNEGRMTNHYCYGEWFKENTKHPHTYGKPFIKPDNIIIAPLNPLRKRLIGFTN